MDVKSALNCSATTNVTENSSLCPSQLLRPPLRPMVEPYDEYYKFAFGSAIYMIMVSFTTILANGLLLVVLFVDPLKIFCTATTYFLIGLAFVDIVIAALQEPMTATCYIIMILKHPDTSDTCTLLLDVGEKIAFAAMNASFLIVFAFTIIQYIVVISPLKYARSVTKARVITCVILIYIYSIFCSIVSVMGVSEDIFAKIDLFLHSFPIIYITTFFYILLHKAFKKQLSAAENLREGNNIHNRDLNSRHTTLESRFVTVNLFLIAILFLSAQPYAILGAVYLYSAEDNFSSPKVLISFLMLENLLYLKFLLDPFVYAWRIPKYRQALKIVLRCRRKEPDKTLNDRVVARMSKTPKNVITLDIKHTSPD